MAASAFAYPGTCTVCLNEGKTSPAVTWCETCDSSFCPECFHIHNKMPVSRSHQYTVIDVKDKKHFECDKHPGKTIELFCDDCKVPICTICCSINHRSCEKVVTIQDAVPGLKATIGEWGKQLSSEIQETTNEINDKEVKANNIKQKTNAIKSEINDSIQHVTRMMEKRKAQLLEDLSKVTEPDKLATHIRYLKEELKKSQGQSENVKHILETGDEKDICDMYESAKSYGDHQMLMKTHVVKKPENVKYFHDMEKIREAVDSMKIVDMSPEVTKVFCRYSFNSNIYDIITFTVDTQKLILAADYSNCKIRSHESFDGPMTFTLPTAPWNLVKLSRNRFAVSVPGSKEIIMGKIKSSKIRKVATIQTTKPYSSLALLNQATFVVGSVYSDPSVDIIDMSGNVLRSFTKLKSIRTSIRCPTYLHVTNKGNILISDHSLKSLICLTPTGDVVFRYFPKGNRALLWPRGVTTTVSGDILLADAGLDKVIQLTETGEFVRDILTSENELRQPRALWVDDEYLYVTQANRSWIHVSTGMFLF